MRRSSIFLLLLLAACGDDSGNGNGGSDAAEPVADAAVDASLGNPDADLSAYSSVTGTVWAPGNAPGMVPAGHEIPVFEAIVHLSSTQPPPMNTQVSCVLCTEAPGNSVATGPDGSFTLDRIPAGTYWLVIQKGLFRREEQLIIPEGSTVDLVAEQTTLPSVTDADNGLWAPRIALAGGVHERMEDLLGKIGLGEVDGTGDFVDTSAAGAFDVYSNGNSNLDDYAIGTLTELVSDLDLMLQYQIIFIPCSGTANTAALDDPEVLRNIRDYVAAGGKFYVNDWSGEWVDNVFPAQVELAEADDDTPAEAYDPVTDTWNTSLFGTANGSPKYDSPDAQAVDPGLRDWLSLQVGPHPGGSVGPIDGTYLLVAENWNHIAGLHAVQTGVDDEGQAIIDSPVKYVVGSDGLPGGKKPLTVTYEPAGCGRVLFTTYHTTEDTHVGLVPQERIMLYLIMEIGVCSGPIID